MNPTQVSSPSSVLRPGRVLVGGVASPTLEGGQDLRFAEAEGRRPPGSALLQRYIESVHHAAEHDARVLARFYRVIHMLAPPTALLAPAMLWRVLSRRRPAHGGDAALRAARA